MHTHCIHVYIERERDGEIHVCMYVCMYVCIYIYIYIYQQSVGLARSRVHLCLVHYNAIQQTTILHYA